MTSSTKWMVVIFAVVATFAAGMFLPDNFVNEFNPRNILASFDGLQEGDTRTAASGQLTLPEADQGASGVPKPLPQEGGNNLLLNPGGGNVGIGTFDPLQLLHLSSSRTKVFVETISDVDHTTLQFRRARASTLQVELDDTLGVLLSRGFDGSEFRRAAAIRFRVDGSPGSNDMPGRIDVLAWSWGMRQSSSHTGDGSIVPDFQELELTKYVDKSTPKLMERLAGGVPFRDAHMIVSHAAPRTGHPAR